MKAFAPFAIVFAALADMLLAVLICIMYLISTHKVDEGVKQNAEYIITAEWDRALDADVDLWANGPPDYKKAIFFREKEQKGSALHLDRDSLGYSSDKIKSPTGGFVFLQHKEIITIRGILPGTYNFAINLWRNDAEGMDSRVGHRGQNIKVHLEVIKINPKVETIYSGDPVLDFVGNTDNFFSMKLLPDGSYTKEEPPLIPLSALAVGGTTPQTGLGYSGP